MTESIIYVTSDHHFFHNEIISCFDRPFNSIEEMTEKMIKSWDNIVSPNDIVIHLGDLAFAGNKGIHWLRSKLNGEIHIIVGNHDKYSILKRNGFIVYDDMIKIGNLLFTHYPIDKITNPYYVNVHGHIHNNKTYGRRINVCVEQTNYQPIYIEELFDIADDLLKNKNWGVKTSKDVPKKMCRVCRKQFDKFSMYVTVKGYTCRFCHDRYNMSTCNNFHLLNKSMENNKTFKKA